MSTQQVQFLNFVEAVKRKRSHPDSPFEHDGSTSFTSNRSHKLLRNASYVAQGRLDVPNGAKTYKKEINYAGYRRYIISRNPPKFDADGDMIYDDDELEEGEEAEPLEENPYGKIKLEELYRPLTNAADLPTHPRLHRPYIEKGLPEMVRKAEESLHREQRRFFQMKNLFARYRGDSDWRPVGDMTTHYDELLLAAGQNIQTGSVAQANRSTEPQALPRNETNGPPKINTNHDRNTDGDTVMEDATASSDSNTLQGSLSEGKGAGNHAAETSKNMNTAATATADANGPSSSKSTENGNAPDFVSNGSTAVEANGENLEDDANTNSQPPHRMTTRARAAVSSPSRTPSPSNTEAAFPIHPFYIAPPPPHFSPFAPSTNVTKNLTNPSTTTASSTTIVNSSSHLSGPSAGPIIPTISPQTSAFFPPTSEHPAEIDPVLPLLAYISKQAEVVRLLRSLHEGLLYALRMRKNVFRWCKAEGHVGEMSDGEDWVDLEEWGLEEGELVKGCAEEDENEGERDRGGRRRGRK